MKNDLQPNSIEEKILNIIHKVNKPSRYMGGEIGSIKKDWNKVSLKTALMFPDKYEVGICNLGFRILYNLINKKEDFLCDRAFAPDIDLRDLMKENSIPLYGLDSFIPLAEFDVLAISLQYELSYPTVLAMLEQSYLPIKTCDRTEKHPLVIAGGPGCYNPEPLAPFVDVFIIGDGEDVLTEMLENIAKSKKAGLSKDDTLKNLLKVDGLYIPYFYDQDGDFKKPVPKFDFVPSLVTKRASYLRNEDAPANFPVPYSPSVHDRIVVEIRRGCGRMCRFCQACYTNLPIRERKPEDIASLVRETLKNTGYEEFSLLSLSSNDYKNIEKLVCSLNAEHASKGISVSLPSQRADSFSVELAEQIQSVRKSTMTFAAEAGSQRLRDVINKNLTEEEILDAVFTCYKSGWSKVKLYFMIGLPTETYDDLDAIIELLKKIKKQSWAIKNEFALNKPLDIVCTASIFVPKPFTPFQWCAQDSLDLIHEKIRYLKDAARPLKGVKINVHDSFLSQIEAVFAKGDRRLADLLLKVHEKGSYLDAWQENFNKSTWEESAQESGFELADFACKSFDIDDELPWEVISTGVNKSWLINEYKNAMNAANSAPCDKNCAPCGACENLPVKKTIKSSEVENVDVSNITTVEKSDNVFKYRIKITKKGIFKYISHLDWQSTFYKTVRKAGLNVAFTQGFNPSPKISIGLALPIFVSSESEYVDIELFDDISPDDLAGRLSEFLTDDTKIKKIVKIPKQAESIDLITQWAKYCAFPKNIPLSKNLNLEYIINEVLSNDSLFIQKKTKKGVIKQIDIRPSIHSITLKDGVLEFIIKTGQKLLTEETVSLRADEFIKIISPDIDWEIERKSVLDKNFEELL